MIEFIVFLFIWMIIVLMATIFHQSQVKFFYCFSLKYSFNKILTTKKENKLELNYNVLSGIRMIISLITICVHLTIMASKISLKSSKRSWVENFGIK